MFVLGLISGILISKIFTKKHEKHFYTPDRDIHFKKWIEGPDLIYQDLLFWITSSIIIIMEKISERKRFSLVARAKSFTHAFKGLWILIKSTHNFWIHIFVAVIAILLGFLLKISHIEWMILILTSGFVMVTEAINTAIEIDIDLTSPNYHPYAKDTKDVAAGAVLISAFVAVIVGLIIFIPKTIFLLK